MDAAFGDRRLFKMVLTRLAGGFAQARTRYGSEPSPSLIIVEATDDTDATLVQLDSLAEVCVEGTNLILLGRTNDVEFYRTLMRRGVADYLVLPGGPVRLIEAVGELYGEHTKQPLGSCIAFIGARGGAGSSMLAQNVGYMLAHEAKADVVIADLNLPFGCVDLTFNLEAGHGIHNLLADPARIDETFLQRFTTKYDDRVHLLPAPCSLENGSDLQPRELETVVQLIRRQAHYVVLDLPLIWADWVKLALQMSDRVAVVAVPDLLCVRNARNLIDFLSHGRALDEPPLLVVNRVGLSRRTEVPPQEFATSVGVTGVPVIINEDADAFGRAATVGKMVVEVAPRSRSAEALRQITRRVGGLPGRRAAASPMDTLKRLLAKKRS